MLERGAAGNQIRHATCITELFTASTHTCLYALAQTSLQVSIAPRVVLQDDKLDVGHVVWQAAHAHLRAAPLVQERVELPAHVCNVWFV